MLRPSILAMLAVIAAAAVVAAPLGLGAGRAAAWGPALRRSARGPARDPDRGPARDPDRGRFTIPRRAEQLIVVSSPTLDPPAPGYLAGFRAYERAGRSAPWKPALGPWQAETGSGHLIAAAQRREGDHATPLGVFGISSAMYGTEPNPGGLRYRYHRLVCGDWWDEDPYSPRYNRFVHVRCAQKPAFAAWSEALWTEGNAYPYLAVIDFNTDPILGGHSAPGSGIFLHRWLGTATEGCVALPEPELIRALRWLRPAAHPVIEIALDRELATLS